MKPIRTDEITGLWTYLNSIDWTEPWFLVLGLFHVICAVTTYSTRRHLTVQGIVFAFFLVLVGCSEYINQFAASRWRGDYSRGSAGLLGNISTIEWSFSHQQYFDSNGLFISIVFSMPILINCLIIVVMWLKVSADLMSSIKRKQLQQQAQQQRDSTAEASGTDLQQTKGDAADVSPSDPPVRNRKKD